MVGQPATGTTWQGAGMADVDNRFLDERTGTSVATLVRDARGAATDISPHNADGSVRWSPAAVDQQLRDDLFAFKRVNGFWVTNPNPNEGFHLVAAFQEGKGPGSKPSIDRDEMMIEQSNQPFDSYITKEDEPFSFTGVETAKPFMRRMRNNLPLSDASGNTLVEDPGFLNAGWGKPIDSEPVARQVLHVRSRKISGLAVYHVDGYALATLDDIGAARLGKKGEAAELTYKPLPDGFFMAVIDGVYRPIIKYTWTFGPGWAALGGVPVLSTSAPVATATTTGKANFTFANPTGTGDPWKITAESTADDGVTWVDAPLDTPNAVTSDATLTTVKVKNVASGSKKFRAKVVGTNGASASTPKSNAVTIT